MSVKNISRLEKYRASQAERIEAMSRAIDEGRTTVVSSQTPAWKIIRCIFIGTPYSSKTRFLGCAALAAGYNLDDSPALNSLLSD